MADIEHRAVVKYLAMKVMTAAEIHTDMINTLGDSAPSFSSVFNWTSEFKRSRESMEDNPRSGRSKSVTTPEITEKVVVGDESSSDEIIPTEIPVEEDRGEESSFEEEIPVDIVGPRIKVEPLYDEDYGDNITNSKESTRGGGDNSSKPEESEEVTDETKIEERPTKAEPPDSEEDGYDNTEITNRKRKADTSEGLIEGDMSLGKRRSDLKKSVSET